MALSVTAACAVVLACAWACLPNLAITEPGQPASFCGDGIIEPDAGDGGEQCDPGDAASQACTPDCKVSCTANGGSFPVHDLATNHCYFEVTGTSDIVTAETDCQAYGAHVVRYVSESEVMVVANGSPASLFWVGLRETTVLPSPSLKWLPSDQTTTEPGWNAGCPGCFALADGGTFSIGTDGCVVATADASAPWGQGVCTEKPQQRQTLCEREPPGTRTFPCQQGACFTVAVTSKRYVLFGSTADVGTALEACQALGAQGQLVVFQSPEEREEVGYELGRQMVILDGGAHDFWIGLGTDGGTWSWDGVGGLQPLPWALNEPTDAGSRAYILVQAGTLSSELASAAGPTETHYPLCQY